jgi:hypothetical protein
VTRSLTRAALSSLVVAPLLLAGCSSDPAAPAAASSPTAEVAASSAGTASSSAATGSSAAAGSSSAAGDDAERKETFCREVPGLLGDIGTDLQSVASAPETAPQRMAEAVDQLSAVEPPAGAGPQWQRLVTAVTDMRDLIGRADLTDPSANVELAPELQRLQTELTDSGTAVDDYGKANC